MLRVDRQASRGRAFDGLVGLALVSDRFARVAVVAQAPQVRLVQSSAALAHRHDVVDLGSNDDFSCKLAHDAERLVAQLEAAQFPPSCRVVESTHAMSPQPCIRARGRIGAFPDRIAPPCKGAFRSG